VDYRVLGPLEVIDDGETVGIGPRKQRSLLALLLINVNRVVATDRILEELWGEEAEGKENALWVYVSRLRVVLEPEDSKRGEFSILVTRDHGYLLSVDPQSIDANRFETAVSEGRLLLRDDPSSASALLAEGLAEWRGLPLEDFTYDDFAHREISRLAELRLGALEDRIDADLRLGQTGEIVAELEPLHQQHPLRERVVGQLMLALYRSGRQADALRTFERFRRRVGEELGIDPSPELRRLEEQILLHDARIQAPKPRSRRPAAPAQVANPYKGLRAFDEDEAADFYGRDCLIAKVVRRLRKGDRLIGLVGPSGSGKSSVVRAGLIPALRKGAITESDSWLIAQMVPGSHPFAELEAALLRSSLDAPASLSDQLADQEVGLLRAALRVLPNTDSRLLLVIDQFEELFTLVEDDETRSRFLKQLLMAVDDSHGRVVVVVTLRADYYALPLTHPEFSARLGDGVVNVVPLTPDELEEAARRPAELHQMAIEPPLLAALLTDVIGQPGALPLFQYTLTELFDRRVGDTLTIDAYRAIGRVTGALTRRANDLFAELDDGQRIASRQLFLRLVTITEGDNWARRRVAASEIISLDVDLVALQSVIGIYAQHRLLTLDRDDVTGSPTVEVAHEALLTEWGRLRDWIETGREDIRHHATLTSAMAEWVAAKNNPDYLLTGARLARYEQWAASATMHLTADERHYLDAAIERRERTLGAETQRVALEARTTRSARRRLWGLTAALAVLAAVVAGLFVVSLAPEAPSIAIVFGGRGAGSVDDLFASGFDDATRDFDFEAEEVTPPFTNLEDKYRRLAESGTDLIIAIGPLAGPIWSVAPEYPDTNWAVVDWLPPPGVAAADFAVEQGAYLVGAVAALTSESGTIGFVGGFQIEQIERFRAGYEAGARAVDPDVEILARYVSAADIGDGFTRDDLAKMAASSQYQQGADVVFHAAGQAGLGVFEAAREQSNLRGEHLWAIGVDADQYLDVDPLLGSHILTSMIKRFDVVVYMTIKDFVEGNFEPTYNLLTLTDGVLDFSTTGDHLDGDAVVEVNRFKQEIISGLREVPIVPTGPLDPPSGVEEFTITTVTYDGSQCRYQGPQTFQPGRTVRFDFINATPSRAYLFVDADPLGVGVASPARGNGENSGFVTMAADGRYAIFCSRDLGNLDGAEAGPILTAASS